MSPRSKHDRDAVIGRAFRWSLLALAAGLSLAIGLLTWLNHEPRQEASVREQAPVPVAARETPVEPPAIPFTDITEAAGIDFVHVNGARGEKLLPETMGGGVAFLDYDGDGDPDLLLVNSDYWDPTEAEGKPPAHHALYRNDGTGRFVNVTREAGLTEHFYGMGVAVGDYDNDGDPDLYLTALGTNHLYRNDEGRFVDVTAEAGVAGGEDAWSTSAAFFDYDNDGDLDLFVANYVKWSPELDRKLGFKLTGLGRAYGPPTTFEGTFPYLFRNDGGGHFTDVSAEAGIQIVDEATGQPKAKALGVLPMDMDRDGFMDLFVANDTVQNFLLHNRGDGTFEEVGVEAGVAFDRNGGATGAMGVDAAVLDETDDTVAVAVANFANEMTSLYVGQGQALQFADEAIGAGIGPGSRKVLSFGLFFFDADLDGRLDLLQANGHLENEIHVVQPSQQYAQPAQLYWNCGADCPRQFVLLPPEKIGDLARRRVGRGAAYADIDGDGDLDVVITQVAGRPSLLRNDQGLGHHWLRVLPEGTRSNRDAIGAWVEVRAGDRRQLQQVMPTRSYLSQVERTLTFGLGAAPKAAEVRIQWPDGGEQVLRDVPADRLVRVRQEVQ